MSDEAAVRDLREAADCRLLAELFRFAAGYFLRGPDDETEKVLADPDWCAAAIDSGLVSAEAVAKPMAEHMEQNHQFLSMFRIPGSSFIPPFEQAYREGKATVDDAAVTECLQVYEAAGYKLPPFKHVQGDHLGHQARFLAAILDQEAGCLDKRDEEAAASVATWRTGFVDEHCGWWATFAERVEAARPCRQIRTVTTLLPSLAKAAADG